MIGGERWCNLLWGVRVSVIKGAMPFLTVTRS